MEEPHPPLNTTRTDLPTEILLFNILPRLPAKSIRRFMCVCMQWHSILRTPEFAKIHLRHLTNNDHQNHHKLLVCSLSGPYMFYTIDCETPKDPFPATRSVPFESASYETLSIVASLHGMLCVGITKRSPDDGVYSDLFLWNPLIGEYKTLSKAGLFFHTEVYEKTESPFGLYYSNSDDDYKLLHLNSFHRVYIYSLKSDSWRKVEQTNNDFKMRWFSCNWFSYSYEPPVLLNEKLYFLKQEIGGVCIRNSYSILMFNTKTEKLKEIAAPSFGNQETTCSSFMVHKDRIHLCVTIHIHPTDANNNIELWRMDGDGDWTKVLNYRPMSADLWYFFPLHLMRNGNWLSHSVYPGGGILQVDLEKETKDLVSPYLGVHTPLRGKYIETLVSPNRYRKVTPPSDL